MGNETFWTLITDSAHWEFEVFLIILFDIIIGALIWPRVKRFFKHHKSDDEILKELNSRISALEDKS